MKKLVRITTIPLSLEKLLGGQLCFMSRHYRITAVSSYREELERFGESEGVDTFCIGFTRRITPWKDLTAILRLWRFLRRERPYIVHTHTPKAGLVGMIAARMSGVPWRLHTVAGLPLMEASGLKRQILLLTERLTYLMASRVYPNSTGLREYIQKHRLCPARKLKVIANGSSNGIDTGHFSREHFPEDVCIQTRSDLGIDTHEVVFCFAGRLVSHKGVNELVSAFTGMHSVNKSTRLLLIGATEEELDPLDKETLGTISSHSAILHTGYVGDIRPLLAISDVLVLPSYREGFPNVLLQAGAMDLPCIATDITGCREIINNRINGLTVPAKDATALQKAMECLASDRELRTQMAIHSRKMVAEKYEQGYLWQQLLEEYRSL